MVGIGLVVERVRNGGEGRWVAIMVVLEWTNKATYTAYVAPSRPKSKRVTYGPTDGRTDGPTDGHKL